MKHKSYAKHELDCADLFFKKTDKIITEAPYAYICNNTWDCVSICKGAFFMEKFQVYRDIQARTGGDIYIGVVGPVRTGKSTFIRRFRELVALPEMEPAKQAEVRDQLPLSGSGKLITTVEPKFIPKEAVEVPLGDEQKVRIRLIDCVGFLVKDASGHIEEGKERMVKTPWFEKAIPVS